jgi:hypothetical protein
MTKKQEWEIERDKEKALRQKGLQALTLEQIQAVHDTYEALNSAMISIRDLNDLALSEIKALDEACCDLHREFISQI